MAGMIDAKAPWQHHLENVHKGNKSQTCVRIDQAKPIILLMALVHCIPMVQVVIDNL